MNDKSGRSEPANGCDFESLLIEITSRFVAARTGEVDGRIQQAQQLLCENLGLDRSALFQYSEQNAGALLRTHVYQRPDLPLPPTENAGSGWEVDARQHFPWLYEQIQRGEIVVIPEVVALSAAALDRQNLMKYGIQSLVAVPLSVGGAGLGFLTFIAICQRRIWTEDLVKRFQCIANLFATSLAGEQAETERRHSEARYHGIFDAESDAILVVDCETGRILDANAAAQNMYGYSRDELLQMRDVDLWAESEMKVNSVTHHSDPVPAQLHRRKNTEIFPVKLSFSFLKDRERSAYVATIRNLTEQHKEEEALQQSEERFRQIAEIVGDFIWEVNADGLYTYSSPAVERILGYRPDELIGRMHFYDLFTPETREELKTNFLDIFSEKKSFRSFPNPNISRDKTIVHLETSGLPMIDSAGNLLGYRGATTDVTTRKLAQAALHRSSTEIQELKERLQAESEYLQTQMKITESFGEITGKSAAVKRVLHQIEQVAPADCPVLIQGETGTGKELIAQAIHRLSPRGQRVMVKVNSAALPLALVESELFGREKGAFTGAFTSQAGRFEMADGSTIFLDEVGELSLEIQAKLLRVLQESEFERLGSPKVHKVNVRVIAASNRDLAEEVRLGRFRQDLFYRLSVFPIRVPPLRERVDDIPALVCAFVAEFSSRMGKKITKLPRRTMEMLQRYSWPGNIRELRNVVEHGVILSSDEILRIAPLRNASQADAPAKTLAESEREHILKAFEKTRGRIKGPRGAAEILGINPGTLYSRMRKLGIPNPRARDDMSTES